MFSLFSQFALLSTTGGRIIFPFASRGKSLRPSLAAYVGVAALVFFDLDFEAVADAYDLGSSLETVDKRLLNGCEYVFAFARIKLNCLFVNQVNEAVKLTKSIKESK